MESKIEKIDHIDCITYRNRAILEEDITIVTEGTVSKILQKQNEIIDYLNSQAQPEEITAERLYDVNRKRLEDLTDKELKERGITKTQETTEEWSWKFLKGGCEPTDYSKQPKMEEELHDKLLEIWCGLLPTPSKASFDPEPIRIRIEGTEKYVKQLLDEREREAKIEVLTEIFQTCYQEDSRTLELVQEKLQDLKDLSLVLS